MGVSTFTVCTASGVDLRDYKENTYENITITVTVLRDADWISETDLDKLNISIFNYEGVISFDRLQDDFNSYKSVYTIDEIEDVDAIKENTIYMSDDIHYKVIDGYFYFKVKDLQDLDII